MLVLLFACNLALLSLVMVSRLIQSMLFGPLKLEEWKHLSSRVLYTVVEVTVAFVVCHEPITLKWSAVLAMFLVLKWFHWLAALRVEQMSKSPKLWLVFGLLHFTDIQWLRYSITIYETPEVMSIILAFEMAILYNSLVVTTAHYLFPGSKSLPFVRLASDLIKLAMYLCFSAVLLANFCMPLHLFRECYLSLRISITKVRNLIRNKHLSSVISTSTASITEEDCIICREAMTVTSAVSQLPCKHTLHYDCCFEWLKQSPSCPLCRTSI